MTLALAVYHLLNDPFIVHELTLIGFVTIY